MNKYDKVLKNNRDLRKEFRDSKSPEELENIEVLRKKFLDSRSEGITKEEYIYLIKQYYNVDIEKHFNLEYDRYRAATLVKGDKVISWTALKDEELFIYSKVTKACFIL